VRAGFVSRQKTTINDLKEQRNREELHFANFLKKYYKKKYFETRSRKEAGKVMKSLKKILMPKRAKEAAMRRQNEK